MEMKDLNIINYNNIEKIMLITKNTKIFTEEKFFPEKKRIKTSKHFPSSTREWKNSIFLLNKNNLNIIPTSNNLSIKIIKSYFLLFNNKLESKLRNKIYMNRFRKRSQNKIFVSNGEFKHTNNKIIMGINTFNRQNNNIKLAMKKLRDYLLNRLNFTSKIFWKRFNSIRESSFDCLEEEMFTGLLRKKRFINENSNEILLNIKIDKYMKLYIIKFFLRLLKKEMSKTLQYFFYRQIFYINKRKYSYMYLQYLKEPLYKFYNKEIEFNIVNLRRFYLSSDILLESILKKISKKRKKVLTFIKKVTDKVLVLRKKPVPHIYKVKTSVKKIVLSQDNKQLINTIMNKLKYKDVTGLKLQAKGRLTKRYTASRSLLKVVRKGNLLNKDSSSKGLSTVILKGNLKSNLQYTMLASKSRIGSFGLKNWISSE